MCFFFKRIAKSILPKPIWKILQEIKFQIRLLMYRKELKKRKKLSPFDYVELSKDMQLVTKEYGHNAFYGLADIIKRLEGFPLDKPLFGAVEHGPYYANSINEVDCSQDEIWTLSQARAHFLKEKFPEKKIHAVGPYIQYVKGIYDEQYIKKMKAIHGKTLLVFPPHSTRSEGVIFSEEKFIEEIKRVSETYRFNTVCINMYWKDIETGAEKKYVDAGFQICTAGHIYDPLFLCRLRSIIEMSDMTMGCTVGTHVGYCVVLGKSHYFWGLDVAYTNPAITIKTGSKEEQFYNKFWNDLYGNFSKYHEILTGDDIQVIKYYWGEF